MAVSDAKKTISHSSNVALELNVTYYCTCRVNVVKVLMVAAQLPHVLGQDSTQLLLPVHLILPLWSISVTDLRLVQP